jgi:hypothetical protein
MTEIEISHYKPGDAFKLPGHMKEIFAEQLDTAFLTGDSYTGATENGELVFCCGICLYWKGHAEAWLMLGSPANRYIKAFSKIRDLLEWAVQKYNLFRMSIHCDADWKAANRIAKHLGFSKEAELKNYGPGRETYNLYGRCF